MTQDEIRLRLTAAFRKHVPSGPAVCSEAIAQIPTELRNDKEWMKHNFSHLVESIQVEAYRLYQEYERIGAARAFHEVLGAMLGTDPQKDDFFGLLRDNFTALDRFFLSLTQGRRPRAGKALEQVIALLFKELGYPYSPQPKIDGQPDFVLPSVEHYNAVPMDCIVFTAKRTLRERWRQITTEGARGLHFFLATIDPDVKARDLGEMLASRIYLVVPDSVKRERYPNHANVISFETFLAQHLDPAMNRWRANKVID